MLVCKTTLGSQIAGTIGFPSLKTLLKELNNSVFKVCHTVSQFSLVSIIALLFNGSFL